MCSVHVGRNAHYVCIIRMIPICLNIFYNTTPDFSVRNILDYMLPHMMDHIAELINAFRQNMLIPIVVTKKLNLCRMILIQSIHSQYNFGIIPAEIHTGLEWTRVQLPHHQSGMCLEFTLVAPDAPDSNPSVKL